MVKLPTGIALVCALALTGCSGSRRNVRRAPAWPAAFANYDLTATALQSTRQLEASQACARWSDAPWCSTLVAGWSFVPGAIEVCAKEPDERDARGCMQVCAQRRFSPLALQTCEELQAPKHRRACLVATADRTLEPPQIAHCLAQPDSKTARCLANMHDYTFHPQELQAIVQHTILATPDAAAATRIAALESNLADAYNLDASTWPEHYIFNFAGGATTHIRAMHCAFDEYLIIVGAPIDVNGYSGRYPAEVHDFVFKGLMHEFEEHDHASRDRMPGSWAYLPYEGHRVYSTQTPTYMLEYARGWVPGMLGFGIRHPMRAITRDRKNMRQQVRMCASRSLAAQRANRRRKRARRVEQRTTLRAVRQALRRQRRTSS